MELVSMALLVFITALAVRRREPFEIRWKSDSHTWIAVGTGVVAFVLSASLLLVGIDTIVGRIIHYGLIYVLCGFVLPWGYVLLVERRGCRSMGLQRERWKIGLGLGVLAAALMSPLLVFQADWSMVQPGDYVKSAFVLTGAGGLFELFLYYGFIHLRLEKAFGLILAIMVTSLLYVAWHVGTQLSLEADLLADMWKLFFVGVMYQSLFAVTRNLLTIWPFFRLVGVLLDFAVNIGELRTAATSFPWAVGTVMLMVLSGMILLAVRRRWE